MEIIAITTNDFSCAMPTNGPRFVRSHHYIFVWMEIYKELVKFRIWTANRFGVFLVSIVVFVATSAATKPHCLTSFKVGIPCSSTTWKKEMDCNQCYTCHWKSTNQNSSIASRHRGILPKRMCVHRSIPAGPEMIRMTWQPCAVKIHSNSRQ